VVELLLLKSQAMSKLIEISNKVSSILASYPSEDQLFGSTRKLVLILGQEYSFRYDILTDKRDDLSDEFWMPNISEAENATFVFHNFDNNDDRETRFARIIFLRNTVFNRKIVAKVLFLDVHKLSINRFKHICENCLGYLNCQKNDTQHHCVKYKSRTRRQFFFKFLAEQIKFEEIDMRFFDWDVYDSTEQAVSKIHNEFKEEIQDLAHSVCNYLAPVQAYKNTSITVQIETFTRLQITNELHFNRLDLLPSNFEEVFQRMNISDDTIKNKWTDVKVKQQHWNKNWKYLVYEHHWLDLHFNGSVVAIDKKKKNHILCQANYT
jgi:hypothetical protein